MDNFSTVVEWLSVGGSVTVVSWFVSWLLEDFAWWNALKSQAKKLFIFVVAALIGIGATYLRQNESAIQALLPYLDTVVLVGGAWVATQIAHKVDKA